MDPDPTLPVYTPEAHTDALDAITALINNLQLMKYMSQQCCGIPLTLSYNFPILSFSSKVLSYHNQLGNVIEWHTSKYHGYVEPDI